MFRALFLFLPLLTSYCTKERIVYVEVPAPPQEEPPRQVIQPPRQIVEEKEPSPPSRLPFEQDREALMAFFDATNGSGWVNKTNWGTLNPDWHGVGTRTDPDEPWSSRGERNEQVYSLYLSVNRVEGEIPSDIWKLRDLARMDLSRNRLYGPIPKKFGWFKKLISINLSFNQLTGTIPDLTAYRGGHVGGEFSDKAGLRELVLSGNKLTGPIPEWLRQSDIDRLDLSNNQFSGPLVSSSLPRSAFYIRLSDNQLSGELPQDLMDINAQELRLHNNQFTGEIPKEWGEVKVNRDYMVPSPLPKHLTLSGNNLTGCIPPALFEIRRHDLEQLNLPTCEKDR